MMVASMHITMRGTKKTSKTNIGASTSGGSEQRVKPTAAGCLTPSTEAESNTSENGGSGKATPRMEENAQTTSPLTPERFVLAAVQKGLTGKWLGSKGESYCFEFQSDKRWNCVREWYDSKKNFTVNYDPESDTIWWGTAYTYFMPSVDLVNEPMQIDWYAARDTQMRKPSFSWKRPQDYEHESQQDKAETPWTSAGTEGHDPMVASAIREIKDLLRSQGGSGQLWIPHWHQRFGSSLGPLRSFLEKYPNNFTVTPKDDNRYTVSLTGGSKWQQSDEHGEQDLASAAMDEVEEIICRPDHEGFLWFPSWNERYAAQLGSVRAFLESHPERFQVVAGEGKRYTVWSLADESWFNDQSGSTKGSKKKQQWAADSVWNSGWNDAKDTHRDEHGWSDVTAPILRRWAPKTTSGA
eukprot:gnl/TRDRNA2_/TRDRNA2_173665_c0_seq9.p1 gnl/TRDRNA2_/TRDRNA2_173665_c0~~gnl/TRDRNA2_/TRDRNA2_173665_c0_seq9.p1  ORF type:complete len:410 (-),score=62.27 gnl/TRDRNA2_/TRDRNA2_173665_c0_seq9:66-1295(-)